MTTKENLLAKIKALQTDGFDYDKTKPAGQRFIDVKKSPTTIERDGRIIVSAEDGCLFADYHGEFRGGYPWIHPELVQLAKDNGGYWEWENPGCICFCEN